MLTAKSGGKAISLSQTVDMVSEPDVKERVIKPLVESGGWANSAVDMADKARGTIPQGLN